MVYGESFYSETGDASLHNGCSIPIDCVDTTSVSLDSTNENVIHAP